MIKQVINIPQDKVYKEFIEFAATYSDAFMFMVCNYDNNKSFKTSIKPFLKSISPYSIIRYESNIWPGNITMDRRKHVLEFYKCCEETKAQLLKVNGLYDWGYPDYPEDLCFFKNGYCWFMSTTHEECAFINSNDSVVFNMLKNIGFMFRDLDNDEIVKKCAVEKHPKNQDSIFLDFLSRREPAPPKAACH